LGLFLPTLGLQGVTMTLSEVLYEAACRMSYRHGVRGEFSCLVVSHIRNNPWDEEAYAQLMFGNWVYPTDKVDEAAQLVGWTVKDFRTFMLLMASEAVK
jgi:hypothetical protein